MAICIAFTFGLWWVMLLWTFMLKFLCRHKFSLLLTLPPSPPSLPLPPTLLPPSPPPSPIPSYLHHDHCFDYHHLDLSTASATSLTVLTSTSTFITATFPTTTISFITTATTTVASTSISSTTFTNTTIISPTSATSSVSLSYPITAMQTNVSWLLWLASRSFHQ